MTSPAQIFAIVLLLGFAWLMLRKQKETDGGESETDISTLTIDLTERAKQGKIPPVVGKEDEIERVLHVAARRTKNNPLLIGEPGVGKTAVIEGLARRIALGEVPEAFKGKKVLSLQLVGLMAGTRFRGALEEKLRALIHELETHPRSAMLFVDEVHMIGQARGGEGGFDIADILKPALARGDVQIIGATTWAEYEKYIKPDLALDRRFQPVLVAEPKREEAIQILKGLRTEYETFHKVCIPEETAVAAVDFSIKKIRGRFLPDKALDLIDEACAKVAMSGPHGHACALGLLHAASAQVKADCAEGTPVVLPEDVEDIAEQWSSVGRT